MSTQVITFHSPWSIGNGRWETIGGEMSPFSDGNPNAYLNAPWAVAGSFSDFLFSLITAPGVGNTWTGTFYKSTGTGAPTSTGVTVTISGAATTGTASGPISISAGETLRIKWVATGSPATSGFVNYCCLFNPTTSGESGYLGYSSLYLPAFGSGTGYTSPFWPTYTTSSEDFWNHETAGFGAATKEKLATTIRTPGALTAIYTILASQPGGSDGVKFTLWKALAASPNTFVKQDGTGGTVNTQFSIIGTSQTGNWTGTLPLAIGDRVVLSAEAVGSPGNINISWGSRYAATDPAQSIFGGWFANQLTNVPWYITPNGLQSSTVTGANKGQYIGLAHSSASYIATGLFVRLSGNVTGVGGDSRIFTLHKNGSATAITLTIPLGSSTGSVGGSITIAPGDTWQLVATVTGNPTDNPQFEWSFIQGPPNDAPVVDAGPDQTITAPTDFVTLDGSATDDGNPDPPAELTYLWTKVSGPGTVAFTDATDPASLAFFSEPGVYVLRLTASDSVLTGSDTMIVTYASGDLIPETPCPTGPWTIEIATVDRTDKFKLESASLEYTLGSQGNAECTIIDGGAVASAYRPGTEWLVTISKGSAVFHGRIVSATETSLVDANVGTGTHIRIADYHRALLKTLFTKDYGRYYYSFTWDVEGVNTLHVQTDPEMIDIMPSLGGTVTTRYPHGLSTGDTVRFTDVQNAVPDINGNDYLVNVLSTVQFTVDASLTVQGLGGKIHKLTRLGTIISDIEDALASFGITKVMTSSGPWVMPQSFKNATIEDVLDTVTKEVGYVYRMRVPKTLEVFNIGEVVAGFTLGKTNSNIIGPLSIEKTDEDYTNSLRVLFGPSSSETIRRVDTWYGDGVTQEWTTITPFIYINQTIAYGYVVVDGIALTLGLYGQDVMEWTFDPAASVLHHDGTAPAVGVIINFPYPGSAQAQFSLPDPVAVAAVDGEIYEKLFDAGDVSYETARVKGQAELTRLSFSARTVTLETTVCLSFPGSVIPLNHSERGLTGNWLVVSVRMRDSDAKELAFYTYELLEEGLPTTWIDFWKGR